MRRSAAEIAAFLDDLLRDLEEVMRKIDRVMAGLPDEPRPTKWDNVANTEF
jgi:hypothetical protein